MTRNKPIDVVVFDLGGVLVDWSPRYVFNQAIENAERREFFLNQVCGMQWNLMQDRGRDFARGIAERIREYPDFEAEIRLYDERWEDMLKGPIEGTVRILERLRQQGRHRIYALSNWSRCKFEIAKPRLDFFKHFDGYVISGEVGVIKPEPEIFQTLMARYSVDPVRAVFIDDVKAYVAAAEGLGFTGIQFKGADALEESFKSLGVME